jgi:Cu-Zn family superoxide dismutase
MKSNALVVIPLLFIAACATTGGGGPTASATLAPASGSSVRGTVMFAAMGDKLRITGDVSGLAPGEHGFHVHEVGDCSAADATSAKGHFNPAGKKHGHFDGAEHHAGDMPNLKADASGVARYSADVAMLTIGGGDGNIVGRAVVVHADPDDYASQPAGNSGKRVACGVITSDERARSSY